MALQRQAGRHRLADIAHIGNIGNRRQFHLIFHHPHRDTLLSLSLSVCASEATSGQRSDDEERRPRSFAICGGDEDGDEERCQPASQ